MKRSLFSFILGVVFCQTALAQLGSTVDILTVRALSAQKQVMPGSEFNLAVVLNIFEEYHINSNKPLSEFFIPTEIRFENIPGVSFAKPLFPPALLKKFSFSEDEVAVFEGETVILVPVNIAPTIPLQPLMIHGSIYFQGCNDAVCFAPQEHAFSLELAVVPAGTMIEEVNREIFQKALAQVESQKQIGQPILSLTRDELRAREIIERGLIYAVFAFFFIGLSLNLTPCVYPVIPITVSYFGGQGGTRRGSTFIKALFYQLGIALAFAALGLISGFAGKQWGFMFQSPWFVVVIVTIILLLAASLFGAFEITVPNWLLSKAAQNREGILGSLIMGLTAGVVIAPCAAGIIIGLVGLVAKLGLVVKGTVLFFFMGLGLGLPYLVLASSSGLLDKLPQSGMWMIWVRKFFGLLLVGVAIYFVLPQLEAMYDKLGFLLGVLGLYGGLLLGFFDHSPTDSKTFKRVRWAFGIALIALGFTWMNHAIQAKPAQIEWIHYQGESIESFLQQSKPILIDFYADWCAPCKQLDRETFSNPAVEELARQFTMIKVDCTAPNEAVKAFMTRFAVSGMPTLVFLARSGAELPELREIGFVPAAAFVVSMEKALAAD